MKNKYYKVNHLNDYYLVEFSNNIQNNDVIKRIKKYAYRNCKKEISRNYISLIINCFSKGFSYFHTEIIEVINDNKIIKINKIRPITYLLFTENTNSIYINLVCSLYNKSKLATQLVLKVIEYAKHNNIKKITLDATNKKTEKFYKRFNFISNNIVHGLINMVLIL